MKDKAVESVSLRAALIKLNIEKTKTNGEMNESPFRASMGFMEMIMESRSTRKKCSTLYS